MNYWLTNLAICVIISVLMAGLIIPKILLIAFRKKLFDEVDERKIHRGVVPRLGGIAFLPAMLFSLCLVVGVNMRVGIPNMVGMLAPSIVPLFFLLCALMLMYVVGMADDLVGVRYSAKFLFQIIAALLIVLSGLYIHNLYGFIGIHSWPTWLGYLATILLVVYVTNAVNLIDGIDGLASGLSVIALIFYGYVFYVSGTYTSMLISGAMLGALIPFFYFNVFGNADKHTKIFMGDTGALTVGLILSFMAIVVFNIPQTALPYGENNFIMALAPIMLPCFDVVRVFFHRIRRGCNPFLPDKCHIHHKLLAIGMKQWEALVTILVTDAGFIGLNLWLSSYIQPTWMLLGDIVIWTVLNLILTKMIRHREQTTGKILYQ